ncbi:dihydrodipicolinate synthase [Devosia sp. Root635]|nr:dihydrodipicolinate synthase [Devosia sp. Root635]
MHRNLIQALAGISGILVTPYDESDTIAPTRLAPIVDRAIDAGVHVLVSNGNTSEFFALTLEEALAMLEATVGLVAGRVPLLAGVGRGIRDAATLARKASDCGAAGLMLHQPADPFVSPRGLVDYVRQIEQAARGLPIMLYLRNDLIGTATIADLCSLPSVVGVKWATPNPMRLAEAIAACPPEIIWVGGLAETWAPVLYAAGARGFTSGLINVWPSHSVEIHRALEAGDSRRARTLIAQMRAFEDIRAEEMGGTNVTGVKSALQMQGHDCGPARPPSAWPLTAMQQDRLRNFMTQNKLIGA